MKLDLKIYDVILFTDGSVPNFHMRPLGPQRIATELRKHGYSVKIVDFFHHWLDDIDKLEKLIDQLIGNTTLFVGFSGTYFNKFNTVPAMSSIKSFRDYYKSQMLSTWPVEDLDISNLLENIRNKFPHIKFVYGGELYDYKNKYLINTMDYIVHGFADTTVIEIADHLSKNVPLKFFPSSGKAKIINHDKDATYFDFKNSFTQYLPDDNIVFGDAVAMEASRGCMFQCDFCGYPILGRKKGDANFHKTVETLAEELRHNYENNGINKYIFTDNIFNESASKLEDMLRARDLSKVEFTFCAFSRVELLIKQPEQLQLLKELGMSSTILSIESLHRPSSRTVGKGVDPERVKELTYKMKDLWNNKLNLSGSFIIGLPEDNPDTLGTWIPWLKDKNCPIDGLFMYRLDLHSLGNTLLSQSPEKYGYTDLSFKRGYSYWKNKYWNSIDADRYLYAVMEECWQSGRTRLGGMDIIGFQNAGYSFDELLSISLKDVNFTMLAQRVEDKFKSYQSTLLLPSK